MAEGWVINTYFAWKTTIVHLSVGRVFFGCKLYLREKSRSFLAQQDEFLSKNAHISNFLSKWRKAGGINTYFVWNTTIDPLSVCRVFFGYNVYLRDKSRSSLAQLCTIFCQEMHDISIFFSKWRKSGGINIYFVWNTTIDPLSVCRAFLVIMCICVTNHVLLWLNSVNFFQEIMT